MSSNPDTSAIIVPDFIPTATIVEVTRTTMDVMGTKDEVVGKFVALGWTVDEEHPHGTAMSHPLIPGTTRIVS